jgi:hypothetical protein
VFRTDSKATISKLIIPRRLLEEQTAKVSDSRSGKGADEASSSDHIVQSTDRLRNVVAGLGMSLAMASLILLRKQGRMVKIVGLVVVCGVSILAASTWSLVIAAEAKSERPPKPNGRVTIEIVDDGDSVQFIRGKR